MSHNLVWRDIHAIVVIEIGAPLGGEGVETMSDYLQAISAGTTLERRCIGSYQPSMPRAALGLTAFAMAALTVGAMVVMPALLNSVSADTYTLASATAAAKAPVDVALSPACIDVPEIEGREESVHAGRGIFQAQGSFGRNQVLSSSSQTHI